jgi:hypothetical protein
VFRATEDGGLDEIPPQVTSPIERDVEVSVFDFIKGIVFF